MRRAQTITQHDGESVSRWQLERLVQVWIAVAILWTDWKTSADKRATVKDLEVLALPSAARCELFRKPIEGEPITRFDLTLI